MPAVTLIIFMIPKTDKVSPVLRSALCLLQYLTYLQLVKFIFMVELQNEMVY